MHEQLGEITKQLLSTHTPSLHPGKTISTKILNRYYQFHQDVLNIATQFAKGNPLYRQAWHLDKRPLLILSNQPIPFSKINNKTNLFPWNIDLGILAHADVASGNPGSAKQSHIGKDGFVYGPGNDMKATFPAVLSAVTSAPKAATVVIFIYTNEEIGGQDIEWLVNHGLTLPVIWCPDGAPVPEGKGLISIVPEAKANIKMKITPNNNSSDQRPIFFRMADLLNSVQKEAGAYATLNTIIHTENSKENQIIKTGFTAQLSISGRTPVHASRAEEAEQPLIPHAMANLAQDLEPILKNEFTINAAITIGKTPGITPTEGKIILNISNITNSNKNIPTIQKHLEQLSKKHGFTFKLISNTNAPSYQSKTKIIFNVTADGVKFEKAETLLNKKAAQYGFQTETLIKVDPFHQSLNNPIIQAFETAAKKATGRKNILIKNDTGTNDLTYFPKNAIRLLTGHRGDNWHADLNERSSIPAITALTQTAINFIQTFPLLKYK